MVVGDPSAELLALVRGQGDPPPCQPDSSAMAAARLIRRRFAIALPPPFAAEPGMATPVRAAIPTDAAAIAAIKWRTFGISYRGILPDAFLDHRGIVPPPSHWTERARTGRGLHVWGDRSSVFGYLDCGPADDPNGPWVDEVAAPGLARAESRSVAEVFELYVDPCHQGLGGGSRLLEAAVDGLRAEGYDRIDLSALTNNTVAHDFYLAHGFEPTGEIVPVDLGVVAFDEVRFARTLR